MEGLGEGVAVVVVEFVIEGAGGDEGDARVVDITARDDGLKADEGILVGDLGFEESQRAVEFSITGPGREGACGIGADLRIGGTEEALQQFGTLGLVGFVKGKGLEAAKLVLGFASFEGGDPGIEGGDDFLRVFFEEEALRLVGGPAFGRIDEFEQIREGRLGE